MGLFRRKQRKQPTDDGAVDTAVAVDEAQQIFDEQYRKALRQAGLNRFRSLIDAGAAEMRQEMDESVKQIAADLKEYMKGQLDLTVSRINSELTNQLNERVNDFNRLTGEAQDQAAQSFTRNAQVMHEKYQQLSTSMQQIVASQEVAMITVFQDNKTRVAAVQHEQDKALRSLTENTDNARRQSSELGQMMQKSISDQAAALSAVYQDNLSRVAATRDAQAKALESLERSTQALQQQYDQMSELLNKSVANQKAMLVELINDNMARIIEHYLVGALGEKSDIRAQLPSILEQMEQHKQDMVDDMKL